MNIKEMVLAICQMELLKEREDLEPGGDWEPRIIILQGDKMKEVKIPMALMVNAASKEVLASSIGAFILASEATAACMVLPMWYLNGEAAKSFAQTGRCSIIDEPEKKEGVLIAYHEPDSTDYIISRVTRDSQNPPVLGDWEPFMEGAKVGGRFANSIRDALVLVKEQKEKQGNEKGEATKGRKPKR